MTRENTSSETTLSRTNAPPTGLLCLGKRTPCVMYWSNPYGAIQRREDRKDDEDRGDQLPPSQNSHFGGALRRVDLGQTAWRTAARSGRRAAAVVSEVDLDHTRLGDARGRHQ